MTIAEYIEQDLESRIRSGDSLPEKLTLGALADRYGVSATPVRLALESLIDKDLVVRKDNGRLKVKPPRKTSKKRVQRPQEPTDWESVLAQEILLLSLKGEDCFLREEAMAERLGIGRTLLRKVFNRFAGGGLIEHMPRRGWQVRMFREQDMEAFVDIRESLELKALDLSRPFLVREHLEQLLEGNSRDCVAKSEIDNDLHGYFIAKSGNRYIESFFANHGGYYTVLFDYATLGNRVVSQMAAQHCEILEHVIAKRWSKSRNALSHHIQAQKPNMLKMVKLLKAGD